MDKIKLLIVDDSVLFRDMLSVFLQSDGTIEVVSKAGNSTAALDTIDKNRPDAIMLNLDIPDLDCITFLNDMSSYRIPVIVVTNAPNKQKKCLMAGASQALSKPDTSDSRDIERFARDLSQAVHRVSKGLKPQTAPTGSEIPHPRPTYNAVNPVRQGSSPKVTDETATRNTPGMSMVKSVAEFTQIARDTISQRTKHISEVSGFSSLPEAPKDSYIAASHSQPPRHKETTVIALGASTGGTEALEQVLREFPADTPPVVVVQHMPAGFTKLYSERLNRSCRMQVKEAENGDRLRRGLVIIGAGDFQLRVKKDAAGYYVSSMPGEKVSGHCPSVDVLFRSVAETVGKNAIGAILTGMGRDGADGMLQMRQNGALTIGQDKESCVVYGMPMEAYKNGGVIVQAPLSKIAGIILANLI